MEPLVMVGFVMLVAFCGGWPPLLLTDHTGQSTATFRCGDNVLGCTSVSLPVAVAGSHRPVAEPCGNGGLVGHESNYRVCRGWDRGGDLAAVPPGGIN
jgi:hypothetical protein